MAFKHRYADGWYKNAAGLWVQSEPISAALVAAATTGQAVTKKADGTLELTTISGGGGGGTSYELFGALPLASTFTAVSAANITNTDGAKSLRVSWTASGANQVQLYKKAAPATPYDVCLRMRPALTGNNVQFGLVLRNASSGKLVLFSVNWLGELGAQEWTSGSAFSSQVVTGFQPHIFSGTSPGWLRIHNDGTTLTFYYSADGDLWVSVGTRALASFLSSCDEYGFGGVCQSAAHVFIGSLDAALPT
jgi:hypothetical protein